MSEEENMNQNEEEMDEEILINQEDGEGNNDEVEHDLQEVTPSQA